MRTGVGQRFNSLVYVCLLLSVLFLYTSTYVKTAFTLTTFVFLLTLFISNWKIRINKLSLTFLFIIIYIVLGVIFGFDLSQSLIEIVRFVVYIMFISILSMIVVDERVFESSWNAVFIICVMIQILQFIKIFDMNSVLIAIYPEYKDSIDYKLTLYTNLKLFRSGSIMLACNNYFKLVCIINAKCLNNIIKNKNSVMNYVILALSYVSALLTGSRTCFAILGVFLLFFVFINKNRKGIIKWLLIPIILLFILVFFGDKLSSFFYGSRFFQIVQTESFDYKVNMISQILKGNNTTQLIFGSGPYDESLRPDMFMDSDVGYIIAYYGIFVGLIFILCFMFSLIGHIKRKNASDYRTFDYMICGMIVLSAATSGVILNYRVFCMLLLAVIPNIISSKEVVNG